MFSCCYKNAEKHKQTCKNPNKKGMAEGERLELSRPKPPVFKTVLNSFSINYITNSLTNI